MKSKSDRKWRTGLPNINTDFQKAGISRLPPETITCICLLFLSATLLLIGCSSPSNQTDTDTNTETEENKSTGIIQDSIFDPLFTLHTYDPDRTDDGLTLFTVQGGKETFFHPFWLEFGYLAAIPMDVNGRTDDEILPIWTFADYNGGPFSFIELLPSGRLRTIRGPDGGTVLTEIDPSLPQTVFTYDDVMINHFAVTLPDGNTLAIWSEFNDHEIYGFDVDDDGIREIRMELLRVIGKDGETVWEWSVYENDSNAPVTETYVALTEWWSNCNAVSFIPSETWSEGKNLTGEIFLNCRLLNRLYAIDYPSGDIRWIMGDGGDFGEGFFYHSHDPQITYEYDKKGKRKGLRILMYDNREAPPLGHADICPPDETCPEKLTRYSRVIEVVTDLDYNADIVWKWPSPNNSNFDDYHFYSPIGGGVQRLENGNILITSATDGGNPYLNEVCRGRLLEVVPDGSLTGGDVVWDVTFNDNYGTYRAVRIPKTAVKDWHAQRIPDNPNE